MSEPVAGEIVPHRGKTKIQAEFERNCRLYLDAEGWLKLLTLLRSSSKEDFKWAFDYCVKYGFGKPRESIDVKFGDSIAVSPEELVRQINQLTAGAIAPSPGPTRADEGTA